MYPTGDSMDTHDSDMSIPHKYTPGQKLMRDSTDMDLHDTTGMDSSDLLARTPSPRSRSPTDPNYMLDEEDEDDGHRPIDDSLIDFGFDSPDKKRRRTIKDWCGWGSPTEVPVPHPNRWHSLRGADAPTPGIQELHGDGTQLGYAA